MRNVYWIMLGLALTTAAEAEIYKHVDEQGRVTYSNTPIKGGVKLDLPPPPPSPVVQEPAVRAVEEPSAAPAQPSPKELEKQRVAERRAQLEEELARERQALEEAKALYAEAEKDPEVFSHIVGEDGKPILGAKEGRVVTGENGKPIVVDINGQPVLGRDNKPIPPRVDKSGRPVPYILAADGKPMLGKDGKPVPFQKRRGRNMAWYTEKLNRIQEEIRQHEERIEALELELSRL